MFLHIFADDWNIVNSGAAEHQTLALNGKMANNNPIALNRFNLKELIKQGNLTALEDIVLQGTGDRLLGESSSSPLVQEFLDNLPNYLVRCPLSFVPVYFFIITCFCLFVCDAIYICCMSPNCISLAFLLLFNQKCLASMSVLRNMIAFCFW